MLRPLAIATQSPTKATKKAVGLKSTLESITSARPVQGPVEAPLAKAAREAKEGPAFLRQAEAVKRKERLKAAEGLAIRDVGRSVGKDKLKFDSIFGEVNVTMAPDIAARYQSGDPATKADILKMYHDQALEEGRKAGKEIVPRWKNTEAAKSYELGRTAMGIPSAATEFLATQAPKPFVPDERFNYQPYTPEPTDIGPRALRDIGNVGGALGDQLNAYFQNVPGGYAQFRRDNPDLFQGASNVMRGAAERTYEALPINPMLNLPGQFWESAADLLDPSASLGKTTMGAVGVGGALFPYAKGIGAASTLLKAGSKFGPALEAGLNAAAREGIIGWSMLERNVRARDLANILEGTGAFASKAEKADFIKQIQKDAKEWASKNSKDSNEFLEQQDEFYKNLIRPTLNDLVPQGVSPSVTRAANAAIGGPQFQPAVGQTLAPVTDTRRVSALAGELAIPEGNRYQQLIPDLRTDDEIEQAVMDVYTKLVDGGLPANQATEVVANLARNLKQQVSQTPTKEPWQMTREEFLGEGVPAYKGLSKVDWRTNLPIQSVDATQIGKRAAGYFSSDKAVAEQFAKTLGLPGSTQLTEARISFKRPYEIDAQGRPAREFMTDALNPANNNPELVQALESPDYDGIIIRNTSDEGTVYLPKTAEQIRADITHRAAIEQALAEGKPVPKNVLADYPDLAPTSPITPKITKFLDANESRIKELESRFTGRVLTGIDPDHIEWVARKAIGVAIKAGMSVADAVKQVWNDLEDFIRGDIDVTDAMKEKGIADAEAEVKKLYQDMELPSSWDIVLGVTPSTRIEKPKVTVVDAAKVLEDYTRQLLDNPEAIKLTPENREVVTRMLANALKKETIAAIKKGGEGQGFYSLNIEDADNALEQMFPGITDTQKKLFHIISSPVSNGNTPDKEAAYGLRLFEQFLNTGKFSPTVTATYPIYDSTGKKILANVGETLKVPGGLSGQVITKSYETMQKVFELFGNDEKKILDFFTTEHSKEDFRKVWKQVKSGSPNFDSFEAGPNGGYYGTMLLGPKVGQYSLNKIGLGGTTKDLWFYRMVNRIAGSLIFKDLDKLKNEFENVFDAGFLGTNNLGKQVSNEATSLAAKELGIDERVLQEITWKNEQNIYNKLGVQRSAGTIREGIEKVAAERGIKLQPMDQAKKDAAQKVINDAQAKVLSSVEGQELYKPVKENIQKNRDRIASLEEIIKSQKRSLGKNRQRGAYIPPTKEEIELLARTALDTVYRTGEKVVDTVKNMVRYLDLREEDVNKIYDSIRGLDQEVGKEIPTVQATVPPTDLPDLVATANRITEEVRKSVGLDGATKATPEQIANWTEEARKINTSKLMNDMMSGTGNLRPLSKAEELAVGARLSRALERYSAALDELRATDTPSSELLDRIDSARDEIDEISKFSLAVGTEWGKSGVARQALIRADYTTAGVITRIRKQEKLLSKDSSMAIQATKQEMADAEEFARISREKDDKIAALEKKIEDLKAQGAKEAPKRRLELRRQKLESERDDILSQIMGIRSGEKKVPQPKMTGESGAINIADDVALFELYGKLAKNTIQRGALSLEDVYYYVSEVAKRAGHTITKQGMIDALDAQMLRGRRKDARRATKAELRARQRLYREVERGATRNVAEREREIAAKEAARKAREEAIQIKKDEIAAKKQAIRAEREAQKATSKAEADAYRAAAKKAREEARALAKQLREAERKAKLDARQARRAELTEALGPIARDERKIANLKGRIEDYNRMIESGEFFASRALKEGDEGYELTHLQTQLEQLRYEAKMAKQNVDTIIDDLGQPAWKKVLKEVIELPRYMQLGLDAGALTRQGFDIALVSPTAWTKAAKRGFGAAISNPAKVARLEEEFMRDPEVLKAIANGLAIDGPSAMPEGFVSKAAQKIPLYGRGERFHKTFQNFARYETYRNLTRGQNMNQYQLKETANLINAMTGRGSWKGAQGPLASIFTAPKMYAGQLEVMGKTAKALVDPRFYNNPAYRKLIVRRWLGRMGGLVALKALADATDWEFSINPDDSDFLKLRNGNTVIDVTGGYSSWYKLLFSTLNDAYESGMSEGFTDKLVRSLGYKVSPTVRTPLSLITGKDAIGKPFFRNPDTGEREMNVQDLAKTFAPLIGMQIYEMAGGDEGYADMDAGAKVALGGLGFIGTGVSNYEAREPSRKPEETRWGQFLDSLGVQPR